MKSASIAFKIYTGLGILLVGCGISMVYIMVAGLDTRHSLGEISSIDFPNALLGEEANTSYRQSIQAYEDAALLGETEALQNAGDQYRKALEYLNQISFHGLSLEFRPEDMLAELHEMEQSLSNHYEELAGGKFDDGTAARVEAMNGQTEKFGEQIDMLAGALSQAVKDHLADLDNATQRQQTVSAILFLIAGVLSWSFTFLVVRRTIVRPINAILSKLQGGTRQVKDAVSTVRTASSRLADDSCSQAASLEETARAGEAGAGFAVVADEVRALALRCAKAASDTANLLEHMQSNVTVSAAANQKTAGYLDAVRQTVEKASQRVEDITVASRQQSEGIDQVNTAITSIDQIVQTHAATAQDTAHAAETLATESHTLSEMLQELEKIANGSDAKEARRIA